MSNEDYWSITVDFHGKENKSHICRNTLVKIQIDVFNNRNAMVLETAEKRGEGSLNFHCSDILLEQFIHYYLIVKDGTL